MKIISSASAFYKKYSRNDFGAANPIVFFIDKQCFRLSRKSSSALDQIPLTIRIYILPMAILGSTE
jgi:hypothetical protein